MRVRETVTGSLTEKTNQRLSHGRAHCSASFEQSFVQTTYSGSRTRKSITDACTPRYNAIKQGGGFLPINPFIVETITEVRTPGSGMFQRTADGCIVSYDDGPYWADFRLLVPPDPDPAIIKDMVNRAIADSVGSVFDALTTAVEMGKTANLVQDGFNRLMNFAEYLAYKAKRYRSGRDNPWRTFSDLWLEYRYGWMPIVYTVQDGMLAFQDKVKKGQMLRGSASYTEDLNRSENEILPDNYGQISVGRSIEGKRTYRGFAYAKVTQVQQRRQGVDPLLTGWELIPFSFVFDWFVDMNSYLQAVSPYSQGNILGSGYSIKDDYTSSVSAAYAWYTNGGSGSFSGVGTTYTVERYSRFPLAASFPSLNPRLNAERVTDLASLAFGRLRSFNRILTGRR